MSIDARRHLAAAAFMTLLVLSVFWPAPAVVINDACCHAQLGIDNLSFLGREAPAWDVAFWFIAGFFVLVVFQSSAGDARHGFAEGLGIARRTRLHVRWIDGLIGSFAAVVIALTWRFADAPITEWAERVQSSGIQDTIRVANRFGGGMNPPMVVLFFLIAGVAYRCHRWVSYAVAMAISGAVAGVVVQIVKFAAGRTRPELWLGPFHHAKAAATSFPSGHTVGAFAIGGVLMLSSPSRTMRVATFLLALSVALSRVLAFRHWASDVLASGAIGMLIAAIVVRGVGGATAVSFTDDGSGTQSRDV